MESIVKDKPLVFSDALSIEDVVRQMSLNGNGYLALVNNDGGLYGILTDADIRRAFLKKEYDINKIVNRKPKVLSIDSSEQKIITILKKLRRRHMPLVGKCGTYQGVFCLDNVDFNTKYNWVVIMAGGLGSRMGELTKSTPKPMLKVAGKPVLEHIINNFTENGFVNFLISVNYKKDIIKSYFKDGSSRGINIKYLEENKRLGTAGALSLIDFEIDKPIIVTNGDVLTHLNHESLLEWHNSQNSIATMCVREFQSQIQYGVVDFDSSNSIKKMQEKPSLIHHVNAGIYVISPDATGMVPVDSYFDMPSLFEKLIEEKYQPKAYLIKDYWIDIGMREQFDQANKDYNNDFE